MYVHQGFESICWNFFLLRFQSESVSDSALAGNSSTPAAVVVVNDAKDATKEETTEAAPAVDAGGGAGEVFQDMLEQASEVSHGKNYLYGA